VSSLRNIVWRAKAVKCCVPINFVTHGATLRLELNDGMVVLQYERP